MSPGLACTESNRCAESLQIRWNLWLYLLGSNHGNWTSPTRLVEISSYVFQRHEQLSEIFPFFLVQKWTFPNGFSVIQTLLALRWSDGFPSWFFSEEMTSEMYRDPKKLVEENRRGATRDRPTRWFSSGDFPILSTSHFGHLHTYPYITIEYYWTIE